MKTLKTILFVIFAFFSQTVYSQTKAEFYIGRWYTKPAYIKEFGTDVFNQVNILPKGMFTFCILGLKKDTSEAFLVKIVDMSGSYKIKNGTLECVLPHGEFFLDKIDDHSVKYFPSIQAQEDVIYTREADTPWSNFRIVP